jgi:hypothetical protein
VDGCEEWLAVAAAGGVVAVVADVADVATGVKDVVAAAVGCNATTVHSNT